MHLPYPRGYERISDGETTPMIALKTYRELMLSFLLVSKGNHGPQEFERLFFARRQKEAPTPN